MKLTQEMGRQFYKRAGISENTIRVLAKEAEGNAFVFSKIAIQRGLVERELAGIILGDAIGVIYVNLYKTLFQDEVLTLLPLELAKQYQAIPLFQMEDFVVVACTRPDEIKVEEALTRIIGKPVKLLLSLPDELNAAFALRYESGSKIDDIVLTFDFKQLNTMTLDKLVDLHPIIEIVDSLLLLALKENASDIHIEPKKNECVIRFRIDGILEERFQLPESLAIPLVARFKIMAEMNITERRTSQSGRINFQTPFKVIAIDISTMPILYGEKIVMRLLGSLVESVPANLDKLNISDANLKQLKASLSQKKGLILVAGSTGSGKSTTLYAALNHLNNSDINITTVEYAIEYEMPTINQVQFNAKAGQTFSAVLRSALQQDSDVLLVGGIRDKETAHIVCKASLSGQLVLSSLHADNALQAMMRLCEMGVEAHIVAAAMNGVLAQRLLRRLCEHCKVIHHDLDVTLLPRYFHWKNETLPVFYKPVGCPYCNQKGYKGRLGIFEFLKMDSNLRAYILQGQTYDEMRNYIYSIGFNDLRFDGFIKALQGLTSLEEVLRMTED